MADTKITALAAITTVDPAADVLPIVDISDTSMAASGTTKKITSNQILGSGGTATLASATITGALTVDTTTLVVDATNDRVGIGTATPGSPFHLYANAGGIAQIESINASGPYVIWRTSGTSFGDLGSRLGIEGLGTSTDFMLASRASDLIFGVGSQEKARINSTGNIVMKNAGTGIDFSATANSSGTMTSELLNDYEEGTFTATLKGGTTDPTIAVTTTGKYTKIGNQVFVRIMFGNVSTLGASGTISITGLPFTSATTPEQIGYLMVENMATFTNSSLSSYLPASSTTLSLYTSTSNSVITAITHNAGVARYLWTAITYTAA